MNGAAAFGSFVGFGVFVVAMVVPTVTAFFLISASLNSGLNV